MYGWNNNPPIQRSNVVELPLAPIRPAGAAHHSCACMNWHSFGIIVSLLAAVTMSLGVADVIVTHHTYVMGWGCTPSSKSPAICDPNNLVWTWIGIGIWASIPVFIFGIFAIRKGSNPMTENCWFELLAFWSGFIFAPAMVVISSLEAYKGAGIYYWPYMAPLTADDLAKALIPISIAVVAFVEHIMCASALWDLCCCGHHKRQMMNSSPTMAPPPANSGPTYGMSSGPTYGMSSGPTYGMSSGPTNGMSSGPTYGMSPRSNQFQGSYDYYSGNKGGNQAYNFFKG